MRGRKPADLTVLEGRAIGLFSKALKSGSTADGFVQKARQDPGAA